MDSDVSLNPLPRLLLPPFFHWGEYYLWEKLGPGNPALNPLKRAQITLDFSYNSLILLSQSLDVASDQETPDAGLVWRIRGKKMLITAKVGASGGFS